MHAARIVADHAAEGAAVVRGGIGRKGEVMFLGCGAESIEHDSRLYSGNAATRIDFQNPRHVLRKVEDHCDVAALSSQRRATAAAEQWRTVPPAKCDCGFNIIDIAEQNETNRNLAVVGPVCGIKRTCAAVEANFAADCGAQGFR